MFRISEQWSLNFDKNAYQAPFVALYVHLCSESGLI